MKELQISDLHNPDNVKAIQTNAGLYIEIVPKKQGWQETKGRWQLWEKFLDGRLLCLRQWNKKAVLATYG